MCRTPDHCNGQRWSHRPARISNLKFIFQIYFGRKLMKLPRRRLLHLAVGLALAAVLSIAWAQGKVTAQQALSARADYDVVILDGRVMDPETGLDAIRSVGIRDGKI